MHCLVLCSGCCEPVHEDRTPFGFPVPSVMPQDEPSGVGPEVQKAIKRAFSNLSANLTTVIESRLLDFKRDLVEERDSSVASVVKRVKRSEV